MADTGYPTDRSFVGTILLMTVPNETFAQHVGLLICYYITLSFWSAQTLALSMISRNIAGQTKKTVVVAVNFIVWAAGNAIGECFSRPPGELELEDGKSIRCKAANNSGSKD
jgi:hypothetical protein